MKKKIKKSLVIKIVLAIIVIAVVILVLLKACSGHEYKIIFDSNGGSKIHSIMVKANSLIERPTDPERDGYTFVGWYYNKKLYDFDTKVTKNMTLKAKWSLSDEIALDSTSLTLSVNDTQTLKVTKILDGYDIKDLIWDSSDESIATVDQDGNVKALKEGTVTITVKTSDGKYQSSCIVTVHESETEVVEVSISGAATVLVGNTIHLTANIKPDNAKNKKVTWKSSNNSIATVDENGYVRGLKEGAVTITATTENGKTATYKVTVKNSTHNATNPQTNNNNSSSNSPTPSTPSTVSVISVSIENGTDTMYVGDSRKLTANINPANASDQKVTWSSDHPEIISVDESGNIKANGIGQATITVKTNDGGKTSTITINVAERPASYSITLTALKELTGVFQYSVSVTKDGNAFSDYAAITYNGVTRPFKQYIYTQDVNIDPSIKTASLHLKDGTTIENVSVYYN